MPYDAYFMQVLPASLILTKPEIELLYLAGYTVEYDNLNDCCVTSEEYSGMRWGTELKEVPGIYTIFPKDYDFVEEGQDVSFDPEDIVELVLSRVLCRMNLPYITLEGNNSYGGFACFITPDSTVWFSTASWLRNLREAVDGDTDGTKKE